MITNRDIYHFWSSYSGLHRCAVKALCERHNIAFNSETMGTKTLADRIKRTSKKCQQLLQHRSDPFWDAEFVLSVLPRSVKVAPTPEEHAVQQSQIRKLKRQVPKPSTRTACFAQHCMFYVLFRSAPLCWSFSFKFCCSLCSSFSLWPACLCYLNAVSE